ncbi:MAG TPA: Nramp family divalent metal transporter [Vicinamibacterales bacterium]|nr:Nramp family divalent metal transporter [Vicinamibacterales bacterium]
MTIRAKGRLGPGLVFFFTALGPGTFLTSAVAGATYGYSLLWALALALLFRFVWVNTAASYVLVTRESLLEGYARIGRWLVWTSLFVTIVVRHSSNLYTILLMGNAAHLLVPLPSPASGAIWSVALTLLGVSMIVFGGYPLVERASTAVIVLLGVMLLVAAVLARPDPAAIVRGLFIPIVPNSTGLYSALLLLAAMIGAQAGSMSNLSYAYFATEKGWSGAEDLPRQRGDLLTSTFCRFGIGALLQVTAAATLLPLALKPQSAEHLVGIFSDSMGLAGKVIFGVGLWGICFSSFVSGTMGYSLIVRDICRRFVPGLRFAAGSTAIDQPSRRDPVYRWSVLLLGLSPLYIVFLGVEPVALTLVVRSMVVIVIPVLVGSLMKIANDRTLMGKYRPGAFANAVMALLVVVCLYLTVRDAGEWWRTLTR